MAMVKKLGVAAVVLVAVVVAAGAQAWAIDAPRWVAAIFVEAQKSIGLRWSPVAGATGYKVLRSETAGSGYAEIAAPTAPQHFDTGVEGGSTYYYVLQAVGAGETSANSDERSVTVPGVKKVAIVPPKLKDPTVQAQTEFGKTSFRVGLSWESAGKDAVAYNVYRTESAGKDHQLIGSVSELQYVDATPQVDKTYFYAVSALDSGFQETKLSEEKSVAIKAPEKKAVKAKVENIPLAMRPSKELYRTDAGVNSALASPVDVVLSSTGDLYVLNAATKTISVFSAETGEFKNMFGERGAREDQIVNAFGIGIDSDNNIYLADGMKVLMYTSEGRWKRSFTLPDPEKEIIEAAKPSVRGTPRVTPSDVSETIDGNLLITDNGMHRIVVLDKEGKLVTSFGSYGAGTENFKFPGSTAVNSRGDIVIADSQNRRAVIYDKEYKFKAEIGQAKTLVGAFIGLGGLTADENDDFLVVDPPMATLQLFSGETGKYKYHIADEKMEPDKSSNGQRPVMNILNPCGVAYDRKSKRLYTVLTMLNQLWAVRLLDPPAGKPPEPGAK